ncbi:type II toxin-antitoxin system CcdA family antitoxin [Candidatus Micrarchaeota archaeon]|jgi:post-segregation antitoxin (ccd killing protein)|nr:type II toxin-antitoxin system CcdA family antitoxin [Candidatus Micrarchaeota archaeon]
MKDVILTARVNSSILEECKELDINISETVRAALIEKLEKEKQEKFQELLNKASDSAKKLSTKDLVKEIRRTRDER